MVDNFLKLRILISIEDELMLLMMLFGPRREKTCLWGFVSNKGADQPAHTRSLISAIVIRF